MSISGKESIWFEHRGQDRFEELPSRSITPKIYFKTTRKSWYNMFPRPGLTMQQSRPFGRKSRVRSVYYITTLSPKALRDQGLKPHLGIFMLPWELFLEVVCTLRIQNGHLQSVWTSLHDTNSTTTRCPKQCGSQEFSVNRLKRTISANTVTFNDPWIRR